MNYMGISVNKFLNYSYNHGDLITIYNNRALNQIVWQGKYETIDYHIPYDIQELEVVKWGIENNSIVIYVNYKKDNE